jgi:hypothetical protein
MQMTSDRSQLIAALGNILSNDSHDNKWPNFMAGIMALLSSEDPKSLLTGLLALQEFTKVFQWSVSPKRAPLIHVIETMYPALQTIAMKLVNDHSFRAGEIIKTIVKIFCGSIRVRKMIRECLKELILTL